MSNKVRDDLNLIRTISYTHSSATVKDIFYFLNGLVLLAMNSALANVKNIFLLSGLVEYAKVSAQAWTSGVKIYWDDTAKVLTTASSGNTLAGLAAEDAANPSSTGIIILNPMLASTAALENVIADPGNGGAIPVTASGICSLVSAGIETRALAIPTITGQELVLVLDTDGGNCAVTVASAFNQAGNNKITFDDAGDTVKLVAVTVGGTKAWRLIVNDGATLATV